MNIKNTQYIVVRHYDREHPHIHLVINRVDNDGKTISDSNDRIRNNRVCRELTIKYGLYMPKGKENVKYDRLRGKDKHILSNLKYHFQQDAMHQNSRQCRLQSCIYYH